eukprot:scaffold14633_cov63-Phaeocystis_antarctica.AAC.3
MPRLCGRSSSPSSAHCGPAHPPRAAPCMVLHAHHAAGAARDCLCARPKTGWWRLPDTWRLPESRSQVYDWAYHRAGPCAPKRRVGTKVLQVWPWYSRTACESGECATGYMHSHGLTWA